MISYGSLNSNNTPNKDKVSFQDISK